MYDVMTGAEEAGRGGWDVRNVCVYPVAGRPYYSLKQRQFRSDNLRKSRPQQKDLLLLLEYYYHHY